MQETFDDNKKSTGDQSWALIFYRILWALLLGVAVLGLIIFTKNFVDLELYYWALSVSLYYGAWMTTKWFRMRDRFYNARATVYFRENQLTQEHKQQAELKELYLCLLGNKSPFLKNSKSRKDGEDATLLNVADDEDDNNDSNAMLNVADATLTQE